MKTRIKVIRKYELGVLVSTEYRPQYKKWIFWNPIMRECNGPGHIIATESVTDSVEGSKQIIDEFLYLDSIEEYCTEKVEYKIYPLHQ